MLWWVSCVRQVTAEAKRQSSTAMTKCFDPDVNFWRACVRGVVASEEAQPASSCALLLPPSCSKSLTPSGSNPSRKG